MFLQKIHSQSGSSLVEMLATVLLLGIMGTALVSGIGMIQNTHDKIVCRSNEQVLLSTTLIEMKDWIRYSTEFNEETGRFRTADGIWFAFRNDDAGIQIDFYSDKDGTTASDSIPVVPNANGEISGIRSSYQQIEKTDGAYIIRNIHVGRSDDTGISIEESAVSALHR